MIGLSNNDVISLRSLRFFTFRALRWLEWKPGLTQSSGHCIRLPVASSSAAAAAAAAVLVLEAGRCSSIQQERRAVARTPRDVSTILIQLSDTL